MTAETPFVPAGTVRRRFAADDDPARGDLDELLVAITRIASRQQFDPSIVWTARRLVDNEPGLDGSDRRHATLAVVAFLIAVGEGSTRLPLKDPDYFDTVLERLANSCSARAVETDDPDEKDLLERAANRLASDRKSNPADVLDETVLPTLLGERADDDTPYRPLILCDGGDALTSERLLRKANTQAAAFAELASREVEIPDGNVLREAVEDLASRPTRYETAAGWQPQRLNYEQARAVVLGAMKPLTLITGGPGTGKTTIAVSVLRLLARLGVDPSKVSLAAPTGKAAYRLKESIDEQLTALATGEETPAEPDRNLRQSLPDARTLHRLLGYSARYDRFWRNADRPLDTRVVICDEASMIDVDMMHALVEALPEDAQLVLVGDANQLPAVSGGAVFRDLVGDPGAVEDDVTELIEQLASDEPRGEPREDVSEPARTYTTRLLHSYRMESDDGGRDILRLASSIRNCDDPEDTQLANYLGEPVELEDLKPLEGVTRLHPGTDQTDFVEFWFDRFASILSSGDVALPPGATLGNPLQLVAGEFSDDSHTTLNSLFEHYSKAQLLCVTQVFQTGARAINREMHDLHNTRLRGEQSGEFLPLEPVMAQRNNYDLDVFNGDQGLVAHVHDDETGNTGLHAIFPRSDGRFRPVALSRIRQQLTHAYATSIHKAQGSEFDHVAGVMPEKPLPLLTKQLLYTAVTRAAHSVTISDDEGLFEVGAATPVQRFTSAET